MPLKKIAASARWKEYEKFDKFPMASCVAKLAKKYGENATSMSGPCEGQNLANCVCSQLSDLGIYTDGLAAKVAKVHASKDPYIHSPMKTCIAMFVKEENMDIDSACGACDGLRAAYASTEDLAIEAIAQSMPSMPKPLAKPMDEVITDSDELDIDNSDNSDSIENDITEPTNNPFAGEKDIAEDCQTCDTESLHSDIDSTNNLDMDGDNEMNELSVSMEGDLGSLLDSNSIGFEDKSITIKLPENAVESLKTLFDALKGQIDVSDDSLDNLDGSDELDNSMDSELSDTMDSDNDLNDANSDLEVMPDSMSLEDSDDSLDVSDITEDGDTDESEIPGLDEEPSDSDEMANINDEEIEMESGKDMPKPVLNKHTEIKPEEKSCKCDCDCPCKNEKKDSKQNKSDNKEDKEEKEPKTESNDSKDSKEEVENDSSNKKEAALDNFLFSMKKGANKSYQDSTNNLYDRIMEQLAVKTAQKTKNEEQKVEYKTLSEKKLTKSPAQDSSEIGKYSDGKTMGHEEKFDAKKPDVPRKSQLMGDEDKSLTVNESSDMPSIGTNGKTMDGEGEYKPEKQTAVDGNQGGKTK